MLTAMNEEGGELDHDESEEEVPPPKQAAPANATPAAPAKEAGMVKAKEESGEDDFRQPRGR